MVKACAITIESTAYLPIKTDDSLKNINAPAINPKIGAVIKNLSGASIGGAWSIESPFNSKRAPYLLYDKRVHHIDDTI